MHEFDQSRSGAREEPGTGCAAMLMERVLACDEREPLPLVLITGPSGAGKSMMLRQIARECDARGAGVRRVGLDALEHAAGRCGRGNKGQAAARSVADLFGPGADTRRAKVRASTLALQDHTEAAPASPVDRMLSAMALAGLSDATLLARRPDQLSEGQRWRLALAMAFAQAAHEPGGVLIADEFCSTLDRATAWALCVGLSSAVRRARDSTAGTGARRKAGPPLLSQVRAVVLATAHEDLAEALSPRWHMRLRLDGGAYWSESSETLSDRHLQGGPGHEHDSRQTHKHSRG